MLFKDNKDKDRINQDLNNGVERIVKEEVESIVKEEEVILPPAPVESIPFFGKENDITYWGFSQQGESHINNNSPCQDRCKVVVSERQSPIIIAAIADGVGSCRLSHYGAAIATNASTSYLKKKIDSLDPNSVIEDKWMGDALRGAMQNALDSVREAAEKMEQLEYSFQSTLTIAVYDGANLFLAHSGDDGVIVLTDDGKIELATTRMKGEEISSVYPLQAGDKYWHVVRVNTHVNGFVMATDGVLDSFVMGETENNRIYYPFIQKAFETRQDSSEAVKEVLDLYNNFLMSEEYRITVTDDLTIVAVTNQKVMDSKCFPVFDAEEWDRETKEHKKKVNEILYPGSDFDTPEPDHPIEPNTTDDPKTTDESKTTDAPETKKIPENGETEQQVDQYPQIVDETGGFIDKETVVYFGGTILLSLVFGHALASLYMVLVP